MFSFEGRGAGDNIPNIEVIEILHVDTKLSLPIKSGIYAGIEPMPSFNLFVTHHLIHIAPTTGRHLLGVSQKIQKPAVLLQVVYAA